MVPASGGSRRIGYEPGSKRSPLPRRPEISITPVWVCFSSGEAAKAGCNADSHNHNDTGSVILYRYGKPFLIDVGVETYTQKTFSNQRYEIWTMQSQWHNLPTFGGVQQQTGAAFRAQDMRTAFSGNDVEIPMEFSAAWPAEARLERFACTVRLEKTGFTLYDVCSGEHETAFLSLMLCEAP